MNTIKSENLYTALARIRRRPPLPFSEKNLSNVKLRNSSPTLAQKIARRLSRNDLVRILGMKQKRRINLPTGLKTDINKRAEKLSHTNKGLRRIVRKYGYMSPIVYRPALENLKTISTGRRYIKLLKEFGTHGNSMNENKVKQELGSYARNLGIQNNKHRNAFERIVRFVIFDHKFKRPSANFDRIQQKYKNKKNLNRSNINILIRMAKKIA